MITEEVFCESMHRALKVQGMKKPDRERYIKSHWNKVESRGLCADAIIEDHETMARNHIKAVKKAKEIPTEDQEQKAFVKWFRMAYPDIKLFCAWNQGSRTPAEIAMQKPMGILAGVSDLVILHDKADIWLEMKRKKGGVQSDYQRAFEGYVTGRSCVNYYILGLGAEDAKNKIEKIFLELGE